MTPPVIQASDGCISPTNVVFVVTPFGLKRLGDLTQPTVDKKVAKMLQQILRDMYIEPELLEELDDEQKHVLFCKMREEQLRRWREREEKNEEIERTSGRSNNQRNNRKNNKKVEFLMGTDGKPWTWVMGEHTSDKSIDEILESEAREKALRLAEQEALVASAAAATNFHIDATPSPSFVSDCVSLNEAPSIINHSPPVPAARSKYRQQPSPAAPVVPSPLAAAPSTASLPSSSSSSQLPPPLPATPPPKMNSHYSLFNECKQFLEANNNNNDNSNNIRPPLTNGNANNAAPALAVVETNGGSARNNNNNWLQQKQHEVQQRGENGGSVMCKDAVQLRKRVEQRKDEILETWRARQRASVEEAELASRQQEQFWQEQERKSKEADAQMRAMARQAREVHKRDSMRAADSKPIVPPKMVSLHQTNETSTLNSLTTPAPGFVKQATSHSKDAKLYSRLEVEDWFRNDQLPRHALSDHNGNDPAIWFHGFLSRTESEAALRSYASGTFLVRLHERIRGYVVSYKAIDGKIKHFLVDASQDHCQFFGQNQTVFPTLADLIHYHQLHPITPVGGETLSMPCPRSSGLSSQDSLSLNALLSNLNVL